MWVLLLLLSLKVVAASDCDFAHLNFTQFVSCLNYPSQEIPVTTDDGYILTLFRIQAKNTTIISGKPVLLLWHGLLDCADSWIDNNETMAPGLILANRGYDVWFGNSRGNKYSLGHITLTTQSLQYWNFSWMEMSEFDLPVSFQKIADLTNDKISYIGHSQGTTQLFASLANTNRNPKVYNNLRKFAALGPVTYMAGVEAHVMRKLAMHNTTVKLFERWCSLGCFGGIGPFPMALCNIFPTLCTMGVSLTMKFVVDGNPDVDNFDRKDVLEYHVPAGTSAKNILHWRQEVLSGLFEMYDYGELGNLKKYNQTTPPRYQPSLIQEEIAMFVGTEDLLADSYDATKWFGEMTNATRKDIYYYEIGHLTFLFGKRLPYMNDLLTFLQYPTPMEDNDFLA